MLGIWRHYSSWRRLFEGALAVLWLGFLLYGLYQNRFSQWVHPRYHWVLLAAVPALVLVLVAWFGRLREYRPRHSLWSEGIWLLPLVALFLLQRPSEANWNLQPYQAAVQSVSQTPAGAMGLTSGLAGDPSRSTSDPAEQVPKVSGSISIDASLYASWLASVTAEPERYENRVYTFLSRFDPNPFDPQGRNFLPGRPVMLCCAADAQALGLYAEQTEESRAHMGEWVYVTGRVILGQGAMPQHPEERGAKLEILEIQSAPKPQSIYAYYYGMRDLPDKPNP